MQNTDRQPVIPHTSYLIPLLLFFASQMSAQQELGLHFMPHVWQSNSTNPAFVQDKKLTIGLLGIYSAIAFDGPTYNQTVSKENGKTVVDIDKLISHLEPQNSIRNELGIPSLSFSYKLNNLHLSIGHTVKYTSFLKYPKTLPQVVWQGNAQFIGETVELGHELELAGYHELMTGAAYEVGPVTFGANIKFLSGIAGAATDKNHHSASLYTDPDVYQITLNGDYILHSANTIDYQEFEDVNIDFKYAKLTAKKFFSRNSGMALDFGLRAELGKLEIAASVLDLGKITWDDNVTNYEANQTYQYDGLDFSGALTGDSVTFGDALDTLKAIFKVKETSGSYTTTLTRKIYLSARYKLNEKWAVSGLYYNENYRDKPYSSIAVGVNFSPIEQVNVGATYAFKQPDSYNNIGLNLTFKLGPVQIFGVTDNFFSLINPGDSHSFSARAGAAIFIK
ncbi:MAG: DUF5723 family protein [Saprospiraceae bacterium]|nr:DUF5723 family protein [Saprospiraceae bacterium]MCF8250281.1 DUF5723 family protein [Saprospiraceae bacterium]MCF8280891.1 DUF5723 family protein [Bacteroidales bacterium]MCF8312087.1 DUF5723 family protein [Saprospiraceae bacterium]MCF8440494.1 DUF5723 family protein [Saprospiraceae bacterium]